MRFQKKKRYKGKSVSKGFGIDEAPELGDADSMQVADKEDVLHVDLNEQDLRFTRLITRDVRRVIGSALLLVVIFVGLKIYASRSGVLTRVGHRLVIITRLGH